MRVLDAVQHIVVRRWSGIVTTPGSAAHRFAPRSTREK